MDKLKQVVALTVVVVLAIAAGGWFLLVSPQRSEAAELRTQTADQLRTNTALGREVEVLKAQAAELPAEQAKLDAVAAKIPDNPALPPLIRALTAASEASGVEFVALVPGAPEAVAPASTTATTATEGTPVPSSPTGGLTRIPVTITIVGGFYEAERFVAALEDLPRAFRTVNLTITTGDSPSDTSDEPALEDGRVLETVVVGEVFMASVDAAAVAAGAAPGAEAGSDEETPADGEAAPAAEPADTDAAPVAPAE